ncbi:MAG TPA: glycoside hydrolase domain-containing protein [Solirubrobacterales bacterium]|nr:glycoside hydrolase domain-containing protein [Solirubrobacterales bacterium]
MPLLVAMLLALLGGGAAAAEEQGARTVYFAGEQVQVPPGWPVIRLAEHPRACVRLDRKAVYLGRPSAEQRCPAEAMGRRRAILIGAGSADGSPLGAAGASAAPRAVISVGDFTGLGFDACAAPSRSAMRAWDDSPYRAIGIYIGGLNRGCSQPNLTSSWVAEQVSLGWHLIPTYVGLQAPTSSCTSCALLSAGSATLQGSAAADDAVERAREVGIGPGSPIYFDMEGYSRTASATNATLTFLSAWTQRIHALGYESGVYSSASSGIADLVSRLGTGYFHPDHIWIANWDGRRTADDPYVPDDAWSEHQRIRQYRGGHDERWGGVTINIDNNYVEGGTAGGSGSSATADPKGKVDLVEAPQPGQVRVSGWAFDPSAPGTAVAIRVYVGGKAGKRGAVRQELGPVATQHRPDLAARFRASGGLGGFDVSFPTAKTGRERVCAYAVNLGEGADKKLGCRTVGVRVPLSVLRAEGGPRAVRIGIRCEWPASVQCPGRIALRARKRLHLGRGRTRLVELPIARVPIRLAGGASASVRVPLNRRGIGLLRERGELRARLVVAVPDARIVRWVPLP